MHELLDHVTLSRRRKQRVCSISGCLFVNSTYLLCESRVSFPSCLPVILRPLGFDPAPTYHILFSSTISYAYSPVIFLLVEI
ncbi:hypothetical protein LX32DRAFT_123357 [Colletotrichum zoysiae]|uniref:Uncharacterized protein n=1 Tax=Colletotrichum zoysiae TaxID=1216348 RepID=A0AAD9H9K7_9PEZI|nr:hypothetical protein LX32DRAFT_123357 [Colletotrichum zoysiae]